MRFNSYVFVAFFFVVWTLYVALRHKQQNRLLVVASYFFYAWWDWRFLALLFISTVVDFNCAKGMRARPGGKKLFLLVSILVNLGILGFFKYFNFFSDSATRALSALGLEADFFTLTIILPVGISFYTFQTLAYTIDVYRGKETARPDFFSFALYVAYFPQLVAGPIERSTHLLPQIQTQRKVSNLLIGQGLQLILMGYFKKVFLADGVAPMVDACFKSPQAFGGPALLIGVYLFALQIYGDFAGYTDIARGVSKCFGIELRLNFRQPYLSPNITLFWRRWHMSLSSWLRDYLYIPLGGNRKGNARTYVNNMLTMLIGGLWHGAGWNFIVWGGLHGCYLSIHKLLRGGRKVEEEDWPAGLPRFFTWALKVFITFNLVCLAWVFFRADSLAAAGQYLRHMMAPSFEGAGMLLTYLLFYGSAALLIDALCHRQNEETPFSHRWPPMLRGLAYATMLVLLATLGERDAQPFIYFQF